MDLKRTKQGRHYTTLKKTNLIHKVPYNKYRVLLLYYVSFPLCLELHASSYWQVTSPNTHHQSLSHATFTQRLKTQKKTNIIPDTLLLVCCIMSTLFLSFFQLHLTCKAFLKKNFYPSFMLSIGYSLHAIDYLPVCGVRHPSPRKNQAYRHKISPYP